VVGDVTTTLFDRESVDFWHDRAVFHFLTQPAERDAYVESLRRSLRPGGFALIATFGPSGVAGCPSPGTARVTSSLRSGQDSSW